MSDCSSKGGPPTALATERRSPLQGLQHRSDRSSSSSSTTVSSAIRDREALLLNRAPREEATSNEGRAVLASTSMSLTAPTVGHGAALKEERRSKSMVVRSEMVKPPASDFSSDLKEKKRALSCTAAHKCHDKPPPAAKVSSADNVNAAQDKAALEVADEEDCTVPNDVFIKFKNYESDSETHHDADVHDTDRQPDEDQISPLDVVVETRLQRQRRQRHRSLPSSSSALAAAAATAAFSLANDDFSPQEPVPEEDTSLDSFLDQLQLDLQQQQQQQQHDDDDNSIGTFTSLLVRQQPHLLNTSNNVMDTLGHNSFPSLRHPQNNAASLLYPPSSTENHPNEHHDNRTRRRRHSSYQPRMSSSSSFLDQLQNLDLQEALREQENSRRNSTGMDAIAAAAVAAIETEENASLQNNASQNYAEIANTRNTINRAHPSLSPTTTASAGIPQAHTLNQNMQQQPRGYRRRTSFSERFLSSSSSTFPDITDTPTTLRSVASERNLMSPSLQLREVFTPSSFALPRNPSSVAVPATNNVASAATITQATAPSRTGDIPPPVSHNGSSPLYHAVASNATLQTIQHIIKTTPPSETGKPNSGGLTPLHCGIERYDTSLAVLHLLLESNPSTASMKSNKGQTPVDLLWKRFVDPDDYRGIEIKNKARRIRYWMESIVFDDDDMEDDDYDNRALEQKRRAKTTESATPSPSKPHQETLKGERYAYSKKVLRRKRKAQTLLRTNHEFEEFWTIMVLSIKAAYLGTLHDDENNNNNDQHHAGDEKIKHTGTGSKKKWRILRAAISLHCPALLVRFAAALHPEQLFERDDEQCGRLLLHSVAVECAATATAGRDGTEAVPSRLEGSPSQEQPSSSNTHASSRNAAIKNNREETIIEALLSMYPQAASYHDYDGRLPINLALESYRANSTQNSNSSMSSLWGGCVKDLFMSCPQSISTRDTKTHMMPFMIAAVGDKSDIDCVFRLLREGPIEACR